MTRYELLERIGVGGMAEVFRGRATAVGGFEKPVAIKKILPHLSQDDRFVRMLIAEAKLLSYLRQRNIVQVYDVGLGEDGAYFLVLEYVEGHDLGALFTAMEKQRQRFPVDLALHIGSEVCEALEHAHRAKDEHGRALELVHRDVSPTNVMLSRSGEVKLTDFGIAKKAEHVSVVQTIAGKFAYMSPEQAAAKPIGPQSDIYSLGVILWELTVGRRLFSGVPEFEALRLVREARIQRPRELDPGYSRELEAIIMKAVAPDPKARYASAAAFGAALRDYRYASATAGDPAREIAVLLKRYFGADGKEKNGREDSRGQSRVVRIETVAGFPGEAFVPGGKLRPPAESFDEATRAAPELAAALAASAAAEMSGPATVPVMPAVGKAGARKPPTLPSVDAIDDAETRMIDTRRRDATPTLKEIPMGALVADMEPTGAHAVAGPAEVDLLAAARRRAMITILAVVAGLAIAAFVIAGLLMSSGDDHGDGSRPSEGASGEALDAPKMAPAIKKR
jgi:serine/threonine protein kinase